MFVIAAVSGEPHELPDLVHLATLGPADRGAPFVAMQNSALLEVHAWSLSQ